MYAAMSDREFFAELYAVFHHPSEQVRSILPPDVADWLAQNLVDAAG